MGNLIDVLFGTMLILPIILFGVDLYGISATKTYLEARATTLSYQISKEGGVRASLINELASEDIEINCFGTCQIVSSGQVIKFEISKIYTPIIMNENNFIITVTRTVMVGYL